MYEATAEISHILRCDESHCDDYYTAASAVSIDRPGDNIELGVRGFLEAAESVGWDVSDLDDVRCPKCKEEKS